MTNSMTHHHLCAVVNTAIQEQPIRSTIRILDMGCGSGQLIAFLQGKLHQLRGDLDFELYGFDVTDSHVQASDYFNTTLTMLRQAFPEIEWGKRLHLITSKQAWPFADGFFDFVISNQVMEHVFDHDFSLQQIQRVLKTGGVSIHIFPLKHYLLEGHLLLPFVHWISNRDLLFNYIKICSVLGLGKYKKFYPNGTQANLMDFCQKHTDFMIYETNYLSLTEVYQLAKRNRMRCSFRYTEEYYINKLRQVFQMPLKYEYAHDRHPWWERILFSFFVRVAGITLVLEKQNTY